MKYSQESLGPLFGILNADAIQEILKYLTPADWPNVQRVNQSFFLLSDKPTVRQRIGANVFSWLLKAYAESFKALKLIDQKELKDFLMSQKLSIAQKIIGLFNLIDSLVDKDQELFPSVYFKKSLTILDQFIATNMANYEATAIKQTLQPVKEFLHQLNGHLIKAFRISLAPKADWVANFNFYIENNSLVNPEMLASLKAYINQEKSISRPMNQLTQDALVGRLALAQARQYQDGPCSFFLGRCTRYVWAAFFVLMAGYGAYNIFISSPEKNTKALGLTLIICAGVFLVILIGLGIFFDQVNRRTDIRESLISINNDNNDVAIQIENQAQAPASENTPLLFKAVNAREADINNSDLEMQADLTKK